MLGYLTKSKFSGTLIIMKKGFLIIILALIGLIIGNSFAMGYFYIYKRVPKDDESLLTLYMLLDLSDRVNETNEFVVDELLYERLLTSEADASLKQEVDELKENVDEISAVQEESRDQALLQEFLDTQAIELSNSL